MSDPDREQPGAKLIIGIAGGSGSGKTTVANRIADAFERGQVRVIQHDSYYRDHPELGFEEREQLNFDHPDALETSLLVEHLGRLRRGQSIEVPIYRFDLHRRADEALLVEPAPVIVVEGILSFVDAALRDEFDLKVYVDTEADIRAIRRFRRDTEARGRDFESVRRQYYDSVRPMHQQFVEPSKRFADLIVPEGGENHVAVDVLIGHIRSVLR